MSNLMTDFRYLKHEAMRLADVKLSFHVQGVPGHGARPIFHGGDLEFTTIPALRNYVHRVIDTLAPNTEER